jgi:hypothetical protein
MGINGTAGSNETLSDTSRKKINNSGVYYITLDVEMSIRFSQTHVWRTYKKWTFIARKQNIHLTKKQHISQNFTVQVQWTKYKLQMTEKQTKDRKTTEHGNKEKATAGNWTRAVKPVAQRYRLSYTDPVSNSLYFSPKFTSPRLTSLHSNSHPLSGNR